MFVVFVFLVFLMFFVTSPIRLLVTISTSVPIGWIFVTIRRRVSIRLLLEAGLECEHTK